jgi:hypothetical protein
MTDTQPLRLDTTGQHLGGPLVPAARAAATDPLWVKRCVAQLDRIAGH